jgi:hypothetical protein
MSKFQVRVWCEACRGDPEGCFGGVSELISNRFATREEAEARALEYCGSLPYSYRVEEVNEQAVAFITVSKDAPRIDLPIQ